MIDELTLHRYLDGRLDEQQRRDVDDALRADPAARRTLDALREEARLLGSALELRAEPARRICDKVIAQLNLEERANAAALRTRRMFKRLASAAALAAAFLLCFFLVKPRTPAGSILSGSNATVLVHGEKREGEKGMHFYDGDELLTEKGQFVRLLLSNGELIDLDEFSHLVVDKSGKTTQLRLTKGRAGVITPGGQFPVQIELPSAVVSVEPGTKADVWVPEPAQARWPELFFTPSHFSNLPMLASGKEYAPSVVTVFQGQARVAAGQPSFALRNAEGVLVPEGMRATVANKEIVRRRINAAGSRVLAMRGEEGPHTRDMKNLKAQGWTVIGLLDKPEFELLGRRWGLEDNVQIAEALKELDAALKIDAHAARADKIAAAQQALRQACETLPQNDIRRRFGSTLEGLAHFEEGRARIVVKDAAGSDASASFDAARGRFDDALAVDKNAPDAPNIAVEWQNAYANGDTPTLQNLAPSAQSALIATFRRAAALYWTNAAELRVQPFNLDSEEAALQSAERESRAAEAAAAFEKLHENLGHSVESLAALLGEAFCHEQLNNDAGYRHALDALHVIAAKPLTDTEGPAHHAFEGVRQAALLELTRLNLMRNEARKTFDAAHDFELLYPLEIAPPPAQPSSAAQAVRTELKTGLENQTAAALRDKRYDEAALAASLLLTALDEAEGRDDSPAPAKAQELRHIGVHLDLLEALVGSKDWVKALWEADALNDQVPQEFQSRFERLNAQIKNAMKIK